MSAGGGVSAAGGVVSAGTGGVSAGSLQPASIVMPDNDNASNAARMGALMGLEFSAFMDSSSYSEVARGTGFP
jgi:hypothetical protein